MKDHLRARPHPARRTPAHDRRGGHRPPRAPRPVARAAHRPHRVVHAGRHRHRDQPRLAQPRHGPVPGGDGVPAAALPRAHHPLPRPRRRGALRRLLPLLGRLPGGLHRPPGDRRTSTGGGIPEWFRINFSRCIFCGFCEDACPTYAIQLTPDVEMSEYERPNMVYEKEDLLIAGPGKYHELRLLPGGRPRHRRQGQGRGRERGAAQQTSGACSHDAWAVRT